MADAIKAAFGSMPDHFGFNVTKDYIVNPTSTTSPINNPLPSGYIALVTGGAQGIGEYIARSYIQGGASGVIITGRRAGPLNDTKTALEKLASELGHKVKVTAVTGDAENKETYVKLKEHVEGEFGGRLDAVVCNAGPGNAGPTVWSPNVQDHDLADWDSMVGVNLNGPWYAAHHLLPLLLNGPSTGKTIINITSGAAQVTNTSGNPPPEYCIAKLAQVRLSQTLGEMYAKQGVQVFALHPGGVKTPTTLAVMPEETHGMLTDDVNLCGNVCVWLSKNRPEWLNGRYLSVNWDYAELEGRKDEIVEKELFKFKMAV